jgi:hypothetical protein
MTGPSAKMWQTYTLHGFTVMVIQRWDDPFGTPMVRIADVRDEERGEGMPEATFLAQAILVANPQAIES